MPSDLLGLTRLSGNSNNRIQLTNNENLKNLMPGVENVVPWLLMPELMPMQRELEIDKEEISESERERGIFYSLTVAQLSWVLFSTVLSCFKRWHDCIFRHLCGRRWVSFVSLISCLSVARFNFKSWTHFHEWLLAHRTHHRTRRTRRDTGS